MYQSNRTRGSQERWRRRVSYAAAFGLLLAICGALNHRLVQHRDAHAIGDDLLGPALIAVAERLHGVHNGLLGHGAQNEDFVLELDEFLVEELP